MRKHARTSRLHGPSRLRGEGGGVFVLVAILLPVLFLLTAGGVAGFSLFGSHRELQRAADQSALAGAVALPPFDPKVLVENTPFPIPDTDPWLDLLPVDPPKIGYPVNDPRSVACAVGSAGLSSESAALVSALADQDLFEPPLGDDGEPTSTICNDHRVYPRLEAGSSFDAVDCTNDLVRAVSEATAEPLDPDLLDPVLSPIQDQVNALATLSLNRVLPAALTPRMHVDVYSYIEPPLLSFITSGDGFLLRGSATAYRRIKNAVVVPILPSQQLLIDSGLIEPIDVITDPQNLNRALAEPQADLIAAIDDVDERLDELMATFGEPCQHVLHNLRQDLRDIYDPPQGPAPSARDIVDASIEAAEAAAARTGWPLPDPTNPESLAGEAFYLIGVSVNDLMEPLAATQTPILDVALVVMNEVAEGDYEAAVVNAANAYGLFRATLVE